MHKLKILATDKGVDISLDGFSLDFVTDYKVESSVDGVTELSLKMVVSLVEMGSDYITDNRCSDLHNSAK